MLSERIYNLRRKNGLSQEQLAEKVGVSRQSVSKWEGGLSTPELDKLILLSQIFHTTVDALISEKDENTANNTVYEDIPIVDKADNHAGSKVKLGIGLSLIGAICLILFGIITLVLPSSAEQIRQSSAVTLNGSGIVLLFCVICMVVGAVLIIKNRWR